MRERLVQVYKLVVCLLVVGVSPQIVQAQDSVERSRRPWSIGGSFGLPGYESRADPGLFVLGVQFSQLRPRTLGADISVGTMPRALVHGFIPIGVRLGGILPVSVSDRASFLPSAGISTIAGFGSGSALATFGANAGIGLLLGDPDSTGFRTGVTWHRFGDFGGAIWLFEIGFTRARAR